MAEYHSQRPRPHVRRRVAWGRVIGFLVILIAIIWLVSSCVSSLGEQPEDTETNADVTDIETSVTEPIIINNDVLICLDAGHGGDDVGCENPDIPRYEKDDNLRLTLAVRDKIEATYENAEVLLTRSDDTFVGLSQRCEIANNAGADLFVSIHRNSAEEGCGIEIWVNNEEPVNDTMLAYNIITSLENVGIQQNRGVQYGFRGDPTQNYRVNGETTMPSCLVEMGFISNAQDNAFFDDKLDAYAQAIADGIMKTAERISSISPAGNNSPSSSDTTSFSENEAA